MQETPVRSLVGKIPWRRERLPTPVLGPGEFHGLYSLWGHKELDTTERLSLAFTVDLPLIWNLALSLYHLAQVLSLLERFLSPFRHPHFPPCE